MSDTERPQDDKKKADPVDAEAADDVDDEENLIRAIAAELEFDKFVAEQNVARYRCMTTRLAILSDFVARSVPRIGAHPSGEISQGEIEIPASVEKARQKAVIAAYNAIGRMAIDGLVPPQRGKWAADFSFGEGTAIDDAINDF